MSVNLLAEWLQSFQEQSGLSVHGLEAQAVFWVDAGEGRLLAIEWDAQDHTLHLYGHPGHARSSLQTLPGDGPGHGDDDEREEGEASFGQDPSEPGDEMRVFELSADAQEQRSLYVQGRFGLMTLSVKRCLSSLDRTAFVALVEDVLDDLGLWAMLADPVAPAEAGVELKYRGMGAWPLGVVMA
jgi:hypothetical protein